ncbi:A-kinase anchor protein 4, partial [Lemmus lemmus]
ICFVDVSTLNVEDKDSKGADGSSSEGKLNLENLEEKEIIVIKDTKKQDQSKRVLLKHTKEIVSDLIDSCMKNLHNITGDLMTDSDFVSAVKRNLFNHGKQNAADIMEAMLKHLVSALLGEKKETKSQSLAYATYKAGTHDPKCKNQSLEFSSMKGEMKGKHKCKVKTDLCCKSLTSAEKVSEHILKESLIIWNQKQGNQGRVTNKVCANKDEKREKISPSTDSLAKDLIVSTLMLIQYHLTQQAKGKDICEEDCPGSSMGYMSQQSTQYEKCGSGQSTKSLSMKHFESRGAAGPSAYGKESQLDSQKLDMSNMVLSLIQKLLSESPFNSDEPSESDKHSDPRSS